MKVMVVVGTRPELIRLSEVLKLLDATCDLVLVHTGQNYDFELGDIFFRDLALPQIDKKLDCAGGCASQTVGEVIKQTSVIIETEKPDCFVVLGDTNSCMSAYAAKRWKIPVFHLEAGNRCFDLNVPEEINRRLVDHLADINICYSSLAKNNLIREGIEPRFCFNLGSPLYEVFAKNIVKIRHSDILGRLDLIDGEYFVCSVHREENVDKENGCMMLAEMLKAVIREFRKPVLLSLHPRTRKRLEAYKIELPSGVITTTPLGFIDYNRLQLGAAAVLSDSGSITEESAMLGFPAVNLRSNHERPEGDEDGGLIMTDLCPLRVVKALTLVLNQDLSPFYPSAANVDNYTAENFSRKFLRVLLSYTPYVEKYVWRKG